MKKSVLLIKRSFSRKISVKEAIWKMDNDDRAICICFCVSQGQGNALTSTLYLFLYGLWQGTVLLQTVAVFVWVMEGNCISPDSICFCMGYGREMYSLSRLCTYCPGCTCFCVGYDREIYLLSRLYVSLCWFQEGQGTVQQNDCTHQLIEPPTVQHQETPTNK